MSQLFTDFCQKHQRVPLTSKGEKPWAYRGWLLYYIQLLQEDPRCSFPDRWGYLEMIINGGDPGPIPQIQFTKPCPKANRTLHDCVEITGDHGRHGWGWGSLRLFLEFLGYGTGVEEEPSRIDDHIQEKLYRTFDAGLWLENPYDYIGHYICEQRGRSSWNPNQFFPTPHNVIECMTLMSAHDMGADMRYKSFNDPCMGTGRMLLHAGNHSLCLSGSDIDPLMVISTKLNGAFYVPWMVCPPPTPQEDR